MTYTIQSKPFSGDRWMFREQAKGQVNAIIELGRIMKMDTKLKMLRESDYRITCGESVLIEMPYQSAFTF